MSKSFHCAFIHGVQRKTISFCRLWRLIECRNINANSERAMKNINCLKICYAVYRVRQKKVPTFENSEQQEYFTDFNDSNSS